jgi:hypothetical protein
MKLSEYRLPSPLKAGGGCCCVRCITLARFLKRLQFQAAEFFPGKRRALPHLYPSGAENAKVGLSKDDLMKPPRERNALLEVFDLYPINPSPGPG